MKNVLLLALCLQGLVVCVLGYSVIPMNKKSNLTLYDRHDQYKRGNAPLGGGAGRVGYYFVELQIGGQQFRVDIDTGSSTLYVVGPDCHLMESRSTPCPYVQSYYQGAATYQSCQDGCYDCQNSVCIMHATYGDGSEVYGAVRTDAIQIGGYTTTGPAAITYLQSESFASTGGETHMDGLWGMAYSRLNGGMPTVIDNLATSGMPNIFSMCFSKNGGYLVMGGIETSFQTATPNYTPITDQGYYSVAVSSIAVGSTTLAVTFPQTIVDSGTTFSYVSQSIMNALRAELQDYASDSWFATEGGSIYCANIIKATLPSIKITFPKVGGGSFTLTMTGSQYTIPCNDAGTSIAFGFIPTSGINILGDSFMQGFNTIFDRTNGQVGFAPVSTANCNGYVALTGSTNTVPGTKSQFSSAGTLIPQIFFLISVVMVLLAY